MRTDEELLLEAGRGDRDSFAPLVERHQAAIVRFVHRYLAIAERATAEDLAQDVFLNAWKYAPTFRGEARAFTWLFRIAVNTCLNHRRHERGKGGRPLTLDAATDESVRASEASDDPVESSERADRVRSALADLPPNQRAAIVLRHFHELSYAEIAEIMHISAAAVESLLHRGRAGLRDAFSVEDS